MPRGDKRHYTDKEKRQEQHIEQGYESRGLSESEAKRRAWAPVMAVLEIAIDELAERLGMDPVELRIANDTQYGLTGAVFTDNEEKLRRAQEEFFVGNLYLNRKCTGALVGVHPFGGFNMSGTDSKAGGRDYLGLFLQAKAISRKVAAQSKTVDRAGE